jgi:hypothetical protein
MAWAHNVAPFGSNNTPMVSDGLSLRLFVVTLIAPDFTERNEKEGLGQDLKRSSFPERCRTK